MKKALLPLICLLLLFSCKKNHDGDTPAPKEDSLGTGWTKITGVTKSYISDIFFVGNTGFLVSNPDHAIFKSTNGGDTWQKVYQSASAFINIGMGSADYAGFIWARGQDKKQILYTTNSGASFDSADIGESDLNDIFYVSPQVAYAINGKLWKTTNGGKNWTAIYTFSGSAMNVLFFLSEQNGWAVANGGLYKTTTGGVSWTPITNHGLGNIGGENPLFFTDINTGYVGNETIIKKTTDGGANWSTVYTSSDGHYRNLHFINSLLGYMSDRNLILKTTDGGATWTREVSLGSNSVVELHFTDENHGWAGTGGGTILKFVK